MKRNDNDCKHTFTDILSMLISIQQSNKCSKGRSLSFSVGLQKVKYESVYHIQKQPLESNRSPNTRISYHSDTILVQRSKILFQTFKIERNCFAS